MALATTQDLYASHFEERERASRLEPAWLRTRRREAFDQFMRDGFPTPRHEEWRFLSLSPVTAGAFSPAPQTSSGRTGARPGDGAASLVFVNGWFAPGLSELAGLPRGVRAGTVADADEAVLESGLGRTIRVPQLAFTALNTALFADAAYLHVPEGLALNAPVHIVHLVEPSSAAFVVHPRLFVVAGADSRLTLVERYEGAPGERYFTNAVTELVVEEGARVEHVKVQRESFAASHVSSTHVQLRGGAHFASQNIVLGGGLVRNDVNAHLGAEGIDCTLNGLYLVDGDRTVDNHTAIDHAMPHCESHEVYKGILDGRGKGIFNGKIFVRQDAQKTDAKQTNKVLLLSDEATINTKPQLEIFADDVKCTHGATVGQLDEEALFYLRARGIGQAEARAMLVHAFAEDIIDRIGIEALRAELEQFLLTRLPLEAL